MPDGRLVSSGNKSNAFCRKHKEYAFKNNASICRPGLWGIPINGYGNGKVVSDGCISLAFCISPHAAKYHRMVRTGLTYGHKKRDTAVSQPC